MQNLLKLFALCALLALALWTGCSDEENATKIVVSIDADAELRQKLTRVEVESYDSDVKSGATPKLIGKLPFEIKSADKTKGVSFPFEFSAVKNEADSFLLVVVGFEGERAVIEQKLRLGFVAGQSRAITVKLSSSCYEVMCADRSSSDWFQRSCDSEQGTCSGVSTEPVFGNDGDAGTTGEDGGVKRDAGGGASTGDAQVSGGAMDAGGNGDTDSGTNGTGNDAGMTMDAGMNGKDAGNNTQVDSGNGPSDSGSVKDTGPMIDAQPVSCGTLTCPATANCVSTPSPHCECKPGYQGAACTNINDCTATSCAAGSTCVDGVMDFTCTCGTGYFQVTPKTCAPQITNLVAGGDACYALRAGGSVIAWGRNPYGQFANGTSSDSNVPLVINELAGVVEIDASEYFMCARRSNGTVGCSGYNSSGELGNGMTAQTATLVNVTGINDAVEIAVGYNHACARRTGGTVSCWGANGGGQLGNPGITSASSTTPVAVAGLTNAVEIAAGGYHNCARRSDNTVVCWGSNVGGQLGDPAVTASNSAALVQVVPGGTAGSPVLVNPVGLSLGEWHSCARLMSNAVVCWGYGGHGELGNGLDTDSPAPVRVTGLSSGVAELRVNRYYSCARKSDGTVACWGAWPGKEVSSPFAISGVTGAVELAAGQFHTCARKSDGQVLCWGQNNYGQFGSGMTAPDADPPTAFTTPVQVKQN